jgi:DNA-binding MarR family transcriptional regulator
VTLSDLIQQTAFESPSQKALLNIFATCAWAGGGIAGSLAEHGVTHAQYNVLRILRGRHPGFYTCSQIAERLLDRTPDVTRLLTRLETSGLLRRRRAAGDRRVVEVEITDAGLAVLASLDAPVRDAMAHMTRHLSDAELGTLSDLLETLRTDQT